MAETICLQGIGQDIGELVGHGGRGYHPVTSCIATTFYGTYYFFTTNLN